MTSDDRQQRQAEMLINRVKKNRRRLRSWVKADGITCYRLYDRDIPEVPLSVDWYDGRLHVSLYENHTHQDQGTSWVNFVSEALHQSLNLDAGTLYIKRRRQARGGTQYGPLGEQGAMIPITEAGLTFFVNLEDYVDTGLFLDHRRTRAMVREMSRDKRVLNLFAYTGAFSVYAAAGGAQTVTTVDLSNTYLDWAERNMAANGFRGARYRYVRDDILAALEETRVEGTYDLIVLDPPTVSKSKRMRRSLDIQQDYPLIITRLLERLSLDGTILFSNNYRRFKMSTDEIRGARIEEITRLTTSKDFESRPNHRCWRITKSDVDRY